eukprot:GHVR01084646.1.p1 GENE.GHVR01084646.1~~GHVR01084646.1.p1  ORF type:complete len:445 (+),score=119.93 GHVR01084646.1:388-1722(+)
MTLPSYGGGSAIAFLDSSDIKTEFITSINENMNAKVIKANDIQTLQKNANQFVSEKTNNMQSTVMLPEDPKSLAIINALSFKGAFVEAFSKGDTTDSQCKGFDSTSVRCKLMNNKSKFDVKKVDKLGTAVYLPLSTTASVRGNMLKGDSFSLMIVLPEGDDQDAIHLVSQQFDKFISHESKKLQVTLSLPKLKFNTNLDFLEVIKDNNSAFKSQFNGNNFEGIGKEFYIAKISHTATIDLFEKGIDASAVTVTGLDAHGPPETLEEITLKVDRPFLLAILTPSDVPLFVGVVTDLTYSGDDNKPTPTGTPTHTPTGTTNKEPTPTATPNKEHTPTGTPTHTPTGTTNKEPTPTTNKEPLVNNNNDPNITDKKTNDVGSDVIKKDGEVVSSKDKKDVEKELSLLEEMSWCHYTIIGAVCGALVGLLIVCGCMYFRKKQTTDQSLL